jgi:hypothetical protein
MIGEKNIKPQTLVKLLLTCLKILIQPLKNKILILWRTKNQSLADNTSSNRNVPTFSVKEEPFDQRKDIYTDQGENDSDSHEPENDLQVEQSKCYNENVGNTTLRY